MANLRRRPGQNRFHVGRVVFQGKDPRFFALKPSKTMVCILPKFFSLIPLPQKNEACSNPIQRMNLLLIRGLNFDLLSCFSGFRLPKNSKFVAVLLSYVVILLSFASQRVFIVFQCVFLFMLLAFQTKTTGKKKHGKASLQTISPSLFPTPPNTFDKEGIEIPPKLRS